MIDELIGFQVKLEMLKTAFGNAVKIGPVAEVDAERGYRLDLGEGPDGPYLSPWYPHPESGGQSSSWMPLSKGQIVGVITAAGDPRQAILLRGGFTDENGPPSDDLAANVLKALGVTITMKDGTLTIEGNVDFVGGYVKHEGKHIDNSHRHEDVETGGDISGVPV